MQQPTAVAVRDSAFQGAIGHPSKRPNAGFEAEQDPLLPSWESGLCFCTGRIQERQGGACPTLTVADRLLEVAQGGPRKLTTQLTTNSTVWCAAGRQYRGGKDTGRVPGSEGDDRD